MLDRQRETLFNVLQNDIEGAVFVDLYAGTGAVGIEALSRGASGDLGRVEPASGRYYPENLRWASQKMRLCARAGWACCFKAQRRHFLSAPLRGASGYNGA
jgi:hypothetical protein